MAEDYMSIKRKWLKTLLMLMMAGSSFAGPIVGPMNPKEIEELLHIMNQTRVEFTLPDENQKGDDKERAEYMRIRRESV